MNTSSSKLSISNSSDSLAITNIIDFEAFYDAYAPAFFGEIKRRFYNEDISQKLLEEVFVKVYQSLNQFDPSKERAFVWALKITRKEISRRKIDMVLNQ